MIEDVRVHLPFLFPIGSGAEHPQIRVVAFDCYASVEIGWENSLFSFTRGREEINVIVAPRLAPNISYELGPVIAALEGSRYADRYAINELQDAANLLQPHLQALNTAFAERDFPTIKQKLW